MYTIVILCTGTCIHVHCICTQDQFQCIEVGNMNIYTYIRAFHGVHTVMILSGLVIQCFIVIRLYSATLYPEGASLIDE